MNLNEIIKKRRAVPPRFLSTQNVSREIIGQLLENANWAPTHKSTEPWRFKVFTGGARIKMADEIFLFLQKQSNNGVEVNLQKVEKLRENIKRVPVVITVIMNRDEAKRIPEWEEIAAVSMAVQNMWLSATAMDLGAFFSTSDFIPLLGEIFSLNANQHVLGFFFVGHVAMEYPSPGRGNIEEKVEWYEE